WRAAVPRSRRRPKIGIVSRRRQSGRPPGNRPAMPSFVATLIGGGREMRSLAAVGGPKIGIISRRRRSGRPPGNRLAMLFVCGNADRPRPGWLQSLAAVAGRKLASFHGADRADAL